MKYALLIYGHADARTPEAVRRTMDPRIAEILERPIVTDWVQLRDVELATTLRPSGSAPPVTDGPFVDSKEYLGGVIVVDVDDLDAALAVARELQAPFPHVAIEVRPVLGA